MGKDHNYLDESANRAIMNRVARNCYLPMNELLLRLIEEYKGKFKVSFSISGLAVEQFKNYAPDVLAGFRKLAATGCAEFVAGTYSNSLASLISADEFREEANRHREMLIKEFGQEPTAFCNTALIYSDTIGETVAEMGYKTMLAEGAKHVLGWKSPNYVYANPISQNLRLLLRNYKLSDDISYRFSDKNWAEWPLTADKFTGWLTDDTTPGEVINLFMAYETFGERQQEESGIFDFLQYFVKQALASKQLSFATVSESTADHQPVSVLHVPHAMSWADEERDVTAWLGNELQNEAFRTLYAQRDKIKYIDNADFDYAWRFLQSSDHFYYMATKWFSDGDVHNSFNPYGSSYEAFINYMNVLGDFIAEVDKQVAAKKATEAKKHRTSTRAKAKTVDA